MSSKARTIAVLAFLLVPTVAAAAAHPPSGAKAALPCEQAAATTDQIAGCAAKGQAKADARLNTAYRDLLRYLDPDQRKQLVAAQRTWLAFRDADCAFFGGGGGSLAAANRLSCEAALTNSRAEELEGWPPNAPRSALQPRH